jgi:hypothetical protein
MTNTYAHRWDMTHGGPPQTHEQAVARAEYVKEQQTQQDKRILMCAVPQGTKVGKHKYAWLGWCVGAAVGVGVGAVLLASAPISVPVGAGIGLTEIVTAAGTSATAATAVSASAKAGANLGDHFDKEDEAREARLQKSDALYRRFVEDSRSFDVEPIAPSGSGSPCGEIREVGLTLHVVGAPATHVGIPIDGCSSCDEVKTGRSDVLFGQGLWPVSTNASTTEHEAKPLEKTTVLIGGNESTTGAAPKDLFDSVMEMTESTEQASTLTSGVFGGAQSLNAIVRGGLPTLLRLGAGLGIYTTTQNAIKGVGESIDGKGPVSQSLDTMSGTFAKLGMRAAGIRYLRFPKIDLGHRPKGTCPTCGDEKKQEPDDVTGSLLAFPP